MSEAHAGDVRSQKPARHLVTICVPAYNSAQTIGATLESILAQSYQNIRVLVLDNASTDTTREVVKAVAVRDPRLTLLEFSENVGFVGNCTRCVQAAAGEFTAIYHADDIYEPWIVEREVALLEACPDVGAVFTEASYINAVGEFVKGGEPLAAVSEGLASYDRYDFASAFNKVLRDTNFFICPSAMVRSEIFRDYVHTWDERFGVSADLEVWLRILEHYPVAILHEPLMRYRLSASQGNVTMNHLRTETSQFIRVVEHYLAKEWVQQLVDMHSEDAFRVHELRDRLRRARIAIMVGDRQLASSLSQGAWGLERLRMLFFPRGMLRWTARAFRTWWAGVTAHLLARLPGQLLIGRLLFYLKYTRRHRKLSGG